MEPILPLLEAMKAVCRLFLAACAALMLALCGSPALAAKRPRAKRVQYGIASWYGARSQGRLMACGQPFNEHALTAAHRTLPLGSRVRVTNLRNGRSVVVKIRDRGPMVRGRVIDLSRAAARRLRFTGRGLAPVRISVLSEPHIPLGADSMAR